MFKPMLSPQEDPLRYPDFFKKLQYPLLVSPKLDGIRAVCKEKNLLSRSGKLIPSFQAQTEFASIEHLDGELIIGNPTDPSVYNNTQSHVMSFAKEGLLSFHVFDYTAPEVLDDPFFVRFDLLKDILKASGLPNYHLVPHTHEVNSTQELLAVEEYYLTEGYEGIMMRNPIGRYKNGRATFNEGLIYKLKRFTDDEAIIIDFKPEMKNNNVKFKDELGYSKRSTHQENMLEMDTLGKFVVLYNDEELDIAPGQLDHPRRKEIWDNRESYRGQALKFRFFEYGVKDKPRQPRAIEIRDSIDL